MRVASFIILLLSFVSINQFVHAKEQKKTIAVTQILEYSVADSIRIAMREHLKNAGYIEGKNIDWVYENAHNNTTTALQIAQKFVSKKPDVIVAISTPSALAFLKPIQGKKIPFIFSSITDPIGAKLIKNKNNPGGWITGTTDLPPLTKQLALIKDFFPKIKTIGVPYNPGEQNAFSMIEKLKKKAKKFNIKLELSTAFRSGDVLMAAKNLAGKVDAIYIPLDNTILQGIEAVIKIGNQHKIPIFAADHDSVRKGALAARGFSHAAIGRCTADMVIRILKGEFPGNIPVQSPQDDEIYVNLDVAKQLNIEVPSTILSKAKLIKTAEKQ